MRGCANRWTRCGAARSLVETTPEQSLLRAARQALGLSQARFAELIDTPVATLRDWEQGRFKPPGSALVLCRIALKSPEALLSVA